MSRRGIWWLRIVGGALFFAALLILPHAMFDRDAGVGVFVLASLLALLGLGCLDVASIFSTGNQS